MLHNLTYPSQYLFLTFVESPSQVYAPLFILMNIIALFSLTEIQNEIF